MKKSIILVVSTIIIVLLVSNPTKKNLYEYLEGEGISTKPYKIDAGTVEISYGRTRYFGVCSIYEWNEHFYISNRKLIYLGIFKNFIELEYWVDDKLVQQ